jgi:hypothetical protein
MGCNLGKNPEIVHRDRQVTVRADREESVPLAEWKENVFGFVDHIHRFYEQCAPKVIPDDQADREGGAAFWKEWRSRRSDDYS